MNGKPEKIRKRKKKKSRKRHGLLWILELLAMCSLPPSCKDQLAIFDQQTTVIFQAQTISTAKLQVLAPGLVYLQGALDVSSQAFWASYAMEVGSRPEQPFFHIQNGNRVFFFFDVFHYRRC